MITEREHWLTVPNQPDWRRQHIADPNISQRETIDAITSVFPDSPRWILEIGCGYGRLTSEVQSRFPASTVCGQDISPTILAEALPGPRYFCQDTLNGLPGMDVVYSVAVFQHLPDIEKQAYIVQAHNLLEPGGVLRVQFIEGDRDTHLDHWVSGEQMVLWAHDAGFVSTRLTRGLVHPEWVWLTAVKQGTSR